MMHRRSLYHLNLYKGLTDKLTNDTEFPSLKLKSGTFTGTTSSNGNIMTSYLYADIAIIAAKLQGNYIEASVTPILFASGGNHWGFNLRGITSPYNPIANVTVTIRYYYFE
jgi:hypothetical protein